MCVCVCMCSAFRKALISTLKHTHQVERVLYSNKRTCKEEDRRITNMRYLLAWQQIYDVIPVSSYGNQQGNMADTVLYPWLSSTPTYVCK